MPTPQARIRRARRMEGLALLVAAVAMLGTIDGHQRANDAQRAADAAQEGVEITRQGQCDNIARSLFATTLRLQTVQGPEPMLDFDNRLRTLRDQLVGAKRLHCERYGLKDFGRRRLKKLIEIDKALGLHGPGQRRRSQRVEEGSVQAPAASTVVVPVQGPQGEKGPAGKPAPPVKKPPTTTTTTPEPPSEPKPCTVGVLGNCVVN